MVSGEPEKLLLAIAAAAGAFLGVRLGGVSLRCEELSSRLYFRLHLR
jgi:hypothetical protein